MATFHFIAFDWFVFAEGGKPQFGVLYCTNYLHLGHKSMMSMVKPIACNRIETVAKTRSAHLVLIFLLIISVCSGLINYVISSVRFLCLWRIQEIYSRMG